MNAEQRVSIEQRALQWFLNGDTGISSKTLCGHMLGIPAEHQSPPHDASDRGRCIRLLMQIPEWIDRLDELKSIEGQTSFVISSSGMRPETNSWAKQIPLILQEMEIAASRPTPSAATP